MDLILKINNILSSYIYMPLRNSLLETTCLIRENSKFLTNYLCIILSTFLILLTLGYYVMVVRCLTWILLGVASSIGFGFGMHTFVLFLAPHIASITMAAHSCNSLDFPEPPYPNEIICPDGWIDPSNEITFLMILRKVALDSFMWGLGTAIGELPPYLAARLRAQAIGRRVTGDQSNKTDGLETAGWEGWMIKIINKVGFIGILLCAAIPNPLFDAAGVASGIAQVPFKSFFGATFIGKAIIKVSLQSSFVILAFHKNNLDTVIQQLNRKLKELVPIFGDISLDKSLTSFLEEQRQSVLTKKLGEQKPPSTIRSIFDWVICICFVLFFMSLINALDNKYRERTAAKKRSPSKKD